MIAVIGKSLLYVLTACALIGVGSQIIRGPGASGEEAQRGRLQNGYSSVQIRPGSSHCDYLQFAQHADSTFWEDICVGGAHPWDTVVFVRPDP